MNNTNIQQFESMLAADNVIKMKSPLLHNFVLFLANYPYMIFILVGLFIIVCSLLFIKLYKICKVRFNDFNFNINFEHIFDFLKSKLPHKCDKAELYMSALTLYEDGVNLLEFDDDDEKREYIEAVLANPDYEIDEEYNKYTKELEYVSFNYIGEED